MNSAVKVVVYIVIGATVIALAQSQYTGTAISSLTGGFANILQAMRGGGASQQSAPPTQVNGTGR